MGPEWEGEDTKADYTRISGGRLSREAGARAPEVSYSESSPTRKRAKRPMEMFSPVFAAV
jgi:hypothetical protein